MSELIRKNDALDILCKFCGITEDVEKCRKTSADGWCKEYCELKNMPTVDAIPIQYILTTIREWNRNGYAESAEALEILVKNWDIENTDWAERKEE